MASIIETLNWQQHPKYHLYLNRTNFLSILALISRAKAKKASSTFMLAFALVSINFIPYSTASYNKKAQIFNDNQQKYNLWICKEILQATIKKRTEMAKSEMLTCSPLVFET